MTTLPQPHRIADDDLKAIIEAFGDNPQNVGSEDGTEDDFGDLVTEFAHALGLGDYGDDEQYGRLDAAMGDSEAVTMRDLAREVEVAFGVRS